MEVKKEPRIGDYVFFIFKYLYRVSKLVQAKNVCSFMLSRHPTTITETSGNSVAGIKFEMSLEVFIVMIIFCDTSNKFELLRLPFHCNHSYLFIYLQPSTNYMPHLPCLPNSYFNPSQHQGNCSLLSSWDKVLKAEFLAPGSAAGRKLKSDRNRETETCSQVELMTPW